MGKYRIIAAETNPENGMGYHNFKVGEIVTRVGRSNFFSNGEYTQFLVPSEYELIGGNT